MYGKQHYRQNQDYHNLYRRTMKLRKKIYYLPQEIQENIYTPGFQWMVLDTSENYKGFYHTYSSTGEVFTESKWHPLKSKVLVPYKDKPKSYFAYDNVKNYVTIDGRKTQITAPTRFDRFSAPIATVRKLTDKEKKNGVMERYFVIKRNERSTKLPIEISPEQASTYSQSVTGINQFLYELVVIPWKVIGPEFDIFDNGILKVSGIYNTNKRIVEKYSKKIPILNKVLTNFREFSIYNT